MGFSKKNHKIFEQNMVFQIEKKKKNEKKFKKFFFLKMSQKAQKTTCFSQKIHFFFQKSFSNFFLKKCKYFQKFFFEIFFFDFGKLLTSFFELAKSRKNRQKRGN